MNDLPSDGDGTGPASGSRGSVLLVEDDPLGAEAMSALLESLGWRVLHAIDAESALERLETDADVDVVLTDIAMPGDFDGAELAVHLRTTRPGLRVVLVTGRVDKVHRAVGDGFELLPKPCSPAELAAALEPRR
ncbi:MAG TPA: response regulator [Burkholderiaceae bacterium]|nr:response regulator [Burkholderiaceae bacterium]